jgi:hypothetical protein
VRAGQREGDLKKRREIAREAREAEGIGGGKLLLYTRKSDAKTLVMTSTMGEMAMYWAFVKPGLWRRERLLVTSWSTRTKTLEKLNWKG